MRGVREHRDDRVQYCGSWFSAASGLPLQGGLTCPRRLARLMAAALRRPWRLAALVVLLLRTRQEHVLLSGSRAGQALRVYFDQCSLGVFPQNRLCRGVLLLPQEHAAYLRGRHRQALRTNLRRAVAAGIRCDVMTDMCEVYDALGDVLRGRVELLADDELRTAVSDFGALFARPETTVTLARDDRGLPLAIAGVIIDDVVCLIRVAVARSHDARWALHDYLVRMLIDRGVRYLVAEGGGPFGALGLETNVHHYQRLLGYELRHVIRVEVVCSG